MKFILQNSIHSSNGSNKLRFGKICSLFRSPNLELETPVLLVNTKAGSVMHLSHEVLMKIDGLIQCLQVPLSNSAKCYEGARGFKRGIVEFAGMKGYLSYCSVHDPAEMLIKGKNEKDQISLNTCNGRIYLSVQRYMEMMEVFQPDIYEALSDSYNDSNSSNRRLCKSTANSINYFDECMSIHGKSEILKKASVFGVIEGGYNSIYKEKIASHLLLNPNVCGFVIGGLHSNGPEVEKIRSSSIESVVHQTLKLLPEDRVKVVHGCFRPDVVVRLIELGVDIFDSSLVDIVTNRGCAFVFGWRSLDKSDAMVNGNSDHAVDCPVKDEAPSYKLEISMKDKVYFDDFGPLLKGCSCVACQKHTRAYIHHLFLTKEMLGPVLLMIHNLHHYLSFFTFIRKTIREGHRVEII
ncbi:queuine tRNA-ribosyltransferase accessory subunit 2 [Nilaparvata lugens]|uniref:queuine tRNA-ribosyltransferase accessory subunit 2 n=1 Tax=Nilaparvata lugens TaxID=108931 RepID=UPI00193EA501|nr:queuine tRNA-ribosyltransferase accessory subunit 2 [Nilaparvata lugens]